MYRYFDFAIESRLALPGLPVGQGRPAWSVAMAAGVDETRDFQQFHAWTSDSGDELMVCSRRGDAYLLEFPQLAGYVIDFDSRRIEALPQAGCAENTLAHLLLDQVLPRAVCHEGRVVLHASAVALENGHAIAFTGVSGRGKSTLASAFYRAGLGLLSDDCLLLEPRDGTVYAIPAYPSLRLWPDSADALFPDGGQQGLQVAEMAHYTSKQVLSPPAADHPAATAAWPLQALFLLQPPADEAEVEIEESRGTAAIMALVEAQFALDVVDRGAVRRNFEGVQQITGQVPLFRLVYPRDFSKLSQVVDKVVNSA